MDETRTKAVYQAAELMQDCVIDLPEIQSATRSMLQAFGEDTEREGLQRTPDRVARMYEELLSGYRTDPIAMVNDALFEEEYDEMVIVRDIEFYSLCEHHLLPFIGRAHVAYIPRGHVIGLSKIPRIVDMFAHRLQVQERMTRQVGDFLNELLQPRGVAVVLEALHLCSMIRGVRKHDTRMTTSTMRGVFHTDMAERNGWNSWIISPGAPSRCTSKFWVNENLNPAGQKPGWIVFYARAISLKVRWVPGWRISGINSDRGIAR